MFIFKSNRFQPITVPNRRFKPLGTYQMPFVDSHAFPNRIRFFFILTSLCNCNSYRANSRNPSVKIVYSFNVLPSISALTQCIIIMPGCSQISREFISAFQCHFRLNPNILSPLEKHFPLSSDFDRVWSIVYTKIYQIQKNQRPTLITQHRRCSVFYGCSRANEMIVRYICRVSLPLSSICKIHDWKIAVDKFSAISFRRLKMPHYRLGAV